MSCIPHIGANQKHQLETGALKLSYANYEDVKGVLSQFNIPKDKKKILFIFAEPIAKRSKTESLQSQIRSLGFKVNAKKTLHSTYFNSPPLTLRAQKKALKDIQEILDLTQNELAAIIGCSPRKIWEILNDKEGVFKQKSHINNFYQLVRLMNQLLSIFKKEDLSKWFKISQKDLKNKIPFELLKSSHIDLLFQWAYMRLEGQYK